MKVEISRFLTFILGDETYGLSIIKVKEIIGLMRITNVPGMPEYIKGVINLRGKIIPALDLRLKFGFPPAEYNDRTCIIVIEIEDEVSSKLIGVIVDSVSEVLDINEENIEEPPAYGSSVNNDFLFGMGKIEDKVIMLLDSDKIISGQVEEEILALGKE